VAEARYPPVAGIGGYRGCSISGLSSRRQRRFYCLFARPPRQARSGAAPIPRAARALISSAPLLRTPAPPPALSLPSFSARVWARFIQISLRWLMEVSDVSRSGSAAVAPVLTPDPLAFLGRVEEAGVLGLHWLGRQRSWLVASGLLPASLAGVCGGVAVATT